MSGFFNNSNTIFIFQISDKYLKVLKCVASNPLKRKFSEVFLIPLVNSKDSLDFSKTVITQLKKCGFNNNPVILSLPRSLATSRYLKVPTQSPEEIEKILSLQAARFLPYPSNELITSYQIIQVDSQGFTHVNLDIIHKNSIESYLKILSEIKSVDYKIVVSTYGLANIYSYLRKDDYHPVMVVDVDADNVEVAIVMSGKLLYSRVFKLHREIGGWQAVLKEDLLKTRDAYVKEIGLQAPQKIVFIGADSMVNLANTAKDDNSIAVEYVTFVGGLKLGNQILKNINATSSSFVSLFGLGVKDIEKSFNLLPEEIKSKNKTTSEYKEYYQVLILFLVLAGVGFLAVQKNYSNRNSYLQEIKSELGTIYDQAKTLDNIQKRLHTIQKQAKNKTFLMEIIYELHKIIPEDIYLVNIAYESNKQCMLHGQTKEIGSLLGLTSKMHESQTFKKFNTKIRFATKKKVPSGDVVDFEIVCTKR